MDVFLLVGQSNMAGRGTIPIVNRERSNTEPYVSPSPRSTNIYNNGSFRTVINGHEILSFDINNKWIPASDPLHYDKPDKCGIGPGLSFAKLIAELDIIDNKRKIGLIPCAVGGTSIKQWLPQKIEEKELNDGLFEKTIKKTKLALNTKFELHSKSSISYKNTYNNTDTDDDQKGDGLDIELKAILWHQGESDCDTQQNANNYLSNSLILFENFRNNLHDDNIPIIVGGLADFLGKNKNDNFIYYNIINRALISLPQRLHNIAFVATNDLNHNGDWLHFDSESAQILGHRYAAKFAVLSGSLTTDELNKYIRFNKFKKALKKHGTKAYEKTKGISFKTWLFGIVCTAVAIYTYKKYYDVDSNNSKAINKQ